MAACYRGELDIYEIFHAIPEFSNFLSQWKNLILF